MGGVIKNVETLRAAQSLNLGQDATGTPFVRTPHPGPLPIGWGEGEDAGLEYILLLTRNNKRLFQNEKKVGRDWEGVIKGFER
jgi:hypothetical protein